MLCQLLLPEDPFGVKAGVVLQVLALGLALAQNFLCKLVSHIRVREVQEHFLVVDQENFQSRLLSQEEASLDFFDLAEAYDFLI